MPQARGSDTSILLFDETTYATEPGTPAGTKLYIERFGVEKSQSLLQSNTLGQGRDRGRPGRGNINVTGPIAIEIGAEDFGRTLKHLLGDVTTTGADPYVHTVVPGDLPVGLHIEKDYGSNIAGVGRYEKYTGCRIGSAQFRFPVEGYCTASFSMVGANLVQSSTSLDGTPEDNGHTSFAMSLASVEEGGSSLALATDIALNIDNGIDNSVFTIGGGGVRRAAPEGFVSVSGTLTALFESTALLNKALAGDESSLKIILSRGNGLGSAGNESIDFFVQQLEYEPRSPAIEGPAGIQIGLSFSGYKSGATDSIEVVCRNEVSSI